MIAAFDHSLNLELNKLKLRLIDFDFKLIINTAIFAKNQAIT